ncbi:MAG TPA: hypothetical protein VMT64_14145, partial [Candidatus Binataceae bacterium]|nr:hypothetical protein [Candidatus Binataceae bacterium]
MSAAATTNVPVPEPGRGFLASNLGEIACVAVSSILYFLGIRFIDLWYVSLAAPLPMLAATFAAPTKL